MFGIFRSDDGLGEVDAVKLSDQPFSADCETTFYQRSACDLCRTKQFKCSGSEEVCDSCSASSSACTYTLSSGKGPGKKRLRKTSMAHPGLRAARAYNSKSSSTRNQHSPTRRGSGGPEPAPAGSTYVSSSTSDTEPPSTAAMDLFADHSWRFLSEFQHSAALDQADNLLLGGRLSPHHTSDGTGGLTDSGMLGESAAGPLPFYDNPLQMELRAPSLNGASSPFSSQPGDGTTPSPQHTTYRGSSAQGPSPQQGAMDGANCACLQTMLELFEFIGVHVGALKEETAEDLFECLDLGSQRCRELVRCPHCSMFARNPVVVATLGRQLLAVADEIVGRFVRCDARGAVPFRYGRHAVASPATRTRLLRTLICCHIDEIQELLGQLKSCVRATAVSVTMLEDARRLAEGLALLVSDCPDNNMPGDREDRL